MEIWREGEVERGKPHPPPATLKRAPLCPTAISSLFLTGSSVPQRGEVRLGEVGGGRGAERRPLSRDVPKRGRGRQVHNAAPQLTLKHPQTSSCTANENMHIAHIHTHTHTACISTDRKPRVDFYFK